MGSGRHAKRPAPAGRGAPAGPGTSAPPPSGGVIATDVVASLVVFLVALPLCIGVAAASGVPVALGIISGIVGGLVVGFLPGSNLQVSGPAAGLAALVLEAVTDHGLEMLGPIVLATGLLQMVLGALKAGRFFQAIPVSVIGGMLAGIGLPLILGQLYALTDHAQLGNALKNIAGLPALFPDTFADRSATQALALGALAVTICALWKKVPKPLGALPAPLVAVALGALLTALLGMGVKTVDFGSLGNAVLIPGPERFAGLADPAVLGVVVTFTVIASAESLFSAAAVDRMHSGPRTRYNPELFSQGVGNAVAGALGALPITAVIARSSANVQAGATTKVSRVLHGAWLLGFGLLLPGVLGLIPVSVLAGILVHSGWKLLDPGQFPEMWRKDRGEGVVMVVTTGAIVVGNLLEGVLAGVAVAILLAAVRMSRVRMDTVTEGDSALLVMSGNATFLRLPQLIATLEPLSARSGVQLDLTAVSHLDLACREEVEEWAQRQRGKGTAVEVLLPRTAPEPWKEPAPLSGQQDVDLRPLGPRQGGRS
ncbi:SulP family inorganic anion transporter [Streptomyces sp. NBC_01381]|uniref:SulP family inorganic anion transporter n=1 Tax=Streptomyces sp. NBC_01381 TaxID=2903845 RepID=UPI00224F8F86|nr:SulP family inorganic anion transporter [Streptomyces sp. NBC_01381]MCX4668069.1 SulP family inorganic anion transporter [Streptomyces sp. NBC_01381]